MEYRKIIAAFETDHLALAEELICDMFFSAGITGVVCHLPLEAPDDGFDNPAPVLDPENRIEGYLPDTADADSVLAHLFQRAKDLGKEGIHVAIRVETVADQDWAHAWKKHFHVMRITDRIVVKPAWKSFDPAPEDLVIHLDPGMAFGTGTHPSTCMSLKQIQDVLVPGHSFLDVGCGSGILMIAAAGLGASRMTGIDTDPTAVEVAGENLAKNRIDPEKYRLSAGTLDQLGPEPFDLIAANIIAQTLAAIMGDIRKRLAPHGRAILSGIIRERQPEVEAALAEHHLAVLHLDTEEEWVTMTVGHQDDSD
jgi:ribosomal protein L11 methyltransferase